MNKQFIALVLVLGLLSQQTLANPTYTCEGTGATAGTPNGFLDIDGTTCLVSGSCSLHTADSGGATAFASLNYDCSKCASNYYKVSMNIKDGCDTTCKTGYATAAGATTTVTADCTSCATGYATSTTSGVTTCVATCPSGQGFTDPTHTACDTTCGAEYSSSESADAEASAGACDYCDSTHYWEDGTKQVCVAANTACTSHWSSTEQGATETAGTAQAGADCLFCSAGYWWDSALKNNCVAPNTACVDNYATADGVATTGTAGAGAHCTSCASGKYFTSTTNTVCGTACEDGYWTASGATTSIDGDCTLTADPSTASSSIITFSIVLVFSLISILI